MKINKLKINGYGKLQNKEIELKDGINIIKCHNCGASIDATKGCCEYCHTKTKRIQEWILVNSKISIK